MANDPWDTRIKSVASLPAYDEMVETIPKIRRGEKMIEQTATVVSVEHGYAWVMPQQKEGSCGACSSKSSCGASSSILDFRRGKSDSGTQKMRVLNPLYARPGDQVIVGIQGDGLVVFSVLAYMLPLLGLILFAILGNAVFGWLGVQGEAGAILGGAAGLLGGLRFANMLAKHSLRSSAFQPVILRGAREHVLFPHAISPS
jgi:sigma-E factor negative regulatory protein RseC